MATNNRVLAPPSERHPKVLIWGAGGHGRVVAELCRLAGLEVLGFVDQDVRMAERVLAPFGARILMSEEDLLRDGLQTVESHSVVPGIGQNAARLAGIERIGSRCAGAVIHPTATVSDSAKIGRGSVILAGAVVNAGAVIGAGVIVNSAAVVEHDCRIADGVHLSPGAVLTGGVIVERLAWVGANATVLPGIRIGAGAIVGAGAVVVRPVGDALTAVGNPARTLDQHRE